MSKLSMFLLYFLRSVTVRSKFDLSAWCEVWPVQCQVFVSYMDALYDIKVAFVLDDAQKRQIICYVWVVPWTPSSHCTSNARFPCNS